MQQDTDSLTTLSKWPFYLGDILLVAIGVSILVLSEGNLSNWQVAFCVLSVSLGALFFVLPHLVEYKVRLTEDRSDRRSEIRVLARQLEALREEIDSLPDVHSGAQSRQAIQSSELLGEALDQHIELAEENRKELTEQVKNALQQLDSVQSELSDLQQQLAQNKAPVEALEQTREKIESLERSLAEADSKFTDAMASQEADIDTKIRSAVSQNIAKQAREPRPNRQRKNPEARLLRRAIRDDSTENSEAMNRIIQLKAQATGPSSVPNQAERSENAVEQSEDAQNFMAEVSLPAELPGTNKLGDTSADLYRGAVPASMSSKSKIKKQDTALTVKSFIGIGNKPYVRGSGGGLSWEKGVAMEFESIGKWCWVATEEFEDEIEFQVLLNDEVPDTTGKHRMAAGDKISIQPEFESV